MTLQRIPAHTDVRKVLTILIQSNSFGIGQGKDVESKLSSPRQPRQATTLTRKQELQYQPDLRKPVRRSDERRPLMC